MLPNKIIILDTETISIDKPYIYDLGYIVAQLNPLTNQYEAIEQHQQIITQIYDNKALFTTAYYEKKRLIYTNLMKGRTAKKEKYGFALQQLKRIMDYHNIDYITAYNSPFDKKALTFTLNFFKNKNIFEGKKWLDILAIANNYIHQTEEYKDFVTKNNFINVSGYILTNAEVTNGFIIGDPNYREPHTSLQDCFIELDILNYCINKGFDNSETLKGAYVTTDKKQTLTIKTKDKEYTFKYTKRYNRKNGVIELK